MKFIVLGTTETTLNLVHGLKETKHKLISLISLDKRNLPNNSVDNKKCAKENGIEYFETADINSKDSIKYLRRLKADFFISTWPKIISLKVLEIPKFGVIGTHPSPIPINRGRHPLHWMIALKIKRSKISFFLMDQGVDTGNVLYQKSFNLGNNINSANQNMNKAAKSGLKSLLKILDENPNFIGQKQPKLYANTLRKRNEHDITIDPRMSSDIILRIVSSFCKPYPMARLYVDKEVFLNLVSAKLLDLKLHRKNWINFEHGYIFKFSGNKFWMKVDNGVMEFKIDNSDVRVSTKNLKGKKIFPPSHYFS